jgi:hypothetical protein
MLCGHPALHFYSITRITIKISVDVVLLEINKQETLLSPVPKIHVLHALHLAEEPSTVGKFLKYERIRVEEMNIRSESLPENTKARGRPN